MAQIARVALWRGGSEVSLETVALPEPGPGETLVEIDLATVCGSDHHTVSGRRSGACPSVLGHEGVGRVVGTDRRVVWGVTVSCGACDRCRGGLTAKCRSVRKLGHERYEAAWPLSGTYATHVLLPAGTAVVPVPDGLADEVASPAGCATATVMAALERTGSLRGRRVLVVGAGMLGLTAIAAAVEAGAADVLVSDVDLGRLELARVFGATTTLAAGRSLPPVDVAMDFSGAAPAVEAALGALDIGGSLVLVGSVSPGPVVGLDPERIVRGWRSVSGVHNYEPRHLEQAVAFLARSTRPWAELVEEPVGLDRVGHVLTTELGRPRASIKPEN